MGFKRSEARMKEIEKKLRPGMEKNGITPETQEKIVQSIYFVRALRISRIACREFCVAGLCQRVPEMPLPGGVYRRHAEQPADGILPPATLVKDAQRHGLKIRPIDVTCSDWLCTLETVRQQNRAGNRLNDAPILPCGWACAT